MSATDVADSSFSANVTLLRDEDVDDDIGVRVELLAIGDRTSLVRLLFAFDVVLRLLAPLRFFRP